MFQGTWRSNKDILVYIGMLWEFGEGVDSARGVAAIVVCCRNSLCNSSCDAIARNGRRTIAFFLLFRVQLFVCNRLCEGMFQTCFECGRHSQVLESHPLPISPLLQTPKCYPVLSLEGLELCKFISRSDLVLISLWMLTMPWIFSPISFSRRKPKGDGRKGTGQKMS